MFDSFYTEIIDTPLASWLRFLPKVLDEWLISQKNNKQFVYYNKILNKISNIAKHDVQVSLKNKVEVSTHCPLEEDEKKRLFHLLKQLIPWRKGPFFIFDIHLDTEWRSDWKWERIIQHFSDFQNKRILDVGCGNGYHMWRMMDYEPKQVIGVDPSVLYFFQFLIIKTLLNKNQDNIHLLPLSLSQLPISTAFDVVFSMGVLYHRQSPITHLMELYQQLVVGGTLILETLIIENKTMHLLCPVSTYAKMNNVWFIPSIDVLMTWLTKCGFKDIQLLDVDYTTTREQRSTQWMQNESLTDFLDEKNNHLTTEGYQAPCRAILLATK